MLISLQKLQELCRVRSIMWNEEGRANNNLNSSKPDEPSLKDSSGGAKTSREDSNRPDTLRVRNIPIYLSKSEVEIIIKEKFGRKPHIHSLAPYTLRLNCATITFPGSDQHFPRKKLQEIKSSPGSTTPSDFQYDNEFLGFTPLHDAGENAIVEYAYLFGIWKYTTNLGE